PRRRRPGARRRWPARPRGLLPLVRRRHDEVGPNGRDRPGPRPDRRQRLPRRSGLVRGRPRLPVGPSVGRRWRPGGARRTVGTPMTDRSTLDRALPMLEILPPPAAADPRLPGTPDDERLAEYLPETRALPRFHMWTLGCQMNRSDSEEMAGRLLQAGCAEATGFDDADLIVINSCAIREGAEQKIIGRQGQLGKLKAAHPGLRVVLTGCAVREPERDGLRRRYPAVDLFLRPDEEPELVDRLGLASAQAPIGAVGGTTVVHRTTVGVADGLSATRATAVETGTVARGSAISAWLPII